MEVLATDLALHEPARWLTDEDIAVGKVRVTQQNHTFDNI